MKICKILLLLIFVLLTFSSFGLATQRNKTLHKSFSGAEIELRLTCNGCSHYVKAVRKLINDGWQDGRAEERQEFISVIIEQDNTVYIIASGSDINRRYNLNNFLGSINRLIQAWGLSSLEMRDGRVTTLSRSIISFSENGEYFIPETDEDGNYSLNIYVKTADLSRSIYDWREKNKEINRAHNEVVRLLRMNAYPNEEHAKLVRAKYQGKKVRNNCATCWKEVNRGKNVATLELYFNDYDTLNIRLAVVKGPNRGVRLIKDLEYHQYRDKVLFSYLPKIIRAAGHTGIGENGIYKR